MQDQKGLKKLGWEQNSYLRNVLMVGVPRLNSRAFRTSESMSITLKKSNIESVISDIVNYTQPFGKSEHQMQKLYVILRKCIGSEKGSSFRTQK